MSRALLAAAAAALLVLPACGDSTAPERAGGSVSFSYEGSLRGSFSASGPLEVDSGGVPHYRSYGAGVKWLSQGTEWVRVVAGAPGAGGRGDVIFLRLPNATGPRTYAVRLICEMEPCARAGFMKDATWSNGQGRFFTMTSGTIQITDASGGRLRGSFSGVMVDYQDLVSGTYATRQIRIDNGTFDVPVFEADEFPGFARATGRPRMD